MKKAAPCMIGKDHLAGKEACAVSDKGGPKGLFTLRFAMTSEASEVFFFI